MDLWVVMVTDGTVVEYPPEVYGSREMARDEATRWALRLARGDESIIEVIDSDRWSVRDVDVRLVGVSIAALSPDVMPWVGTYWTRDGYPDPEAVLLADRAEARAWVRTPPPNALEAASLHEDEWILSATYLVRGEEAYAVAHRAKLVGAQPLSAQIGPDVVGQTEYEVEVTISLLQRLSGIVRGGPGLSKNEVENLVELNMPEISSNIEETLDVSWELESFREI